MKTSQIVVVDGVGLKNVLNDPVAWSIPSMLQYISPPAISQYSHQKNTALHWHREYFKYQNKTYTLHTLQNPMQKLIALAYPFLL